jgi:hypothetical protein
MKARHTPNSLPKELQELIINKALPRYFIGKHYVVTIVETANVEPNPQP